MTESKPQCEFCGNGHNLSDQCRKCIACGRRLGERGPKILEPKIPVTLKLPMIANAQPMLLSKPRNAAICREDCRRLLLDVHERMNGDELNINQLIERMEALAGQPLTRNNSGTPMESVLESVGTLFERRRVYRAPALYVKIKP